MNWDRTETLALARPGCTHCLGLGLKVDGSGEPAPCSCVLRTIFRVCHARFRRLIGQERSLSRISLEADAGGRRRYNWGRKDEEFIADFCLVSKRSLTEAEHRLFRAHFLLGADWKLCCRQLGMDRGRFFHAVYRIQQKLGRVFRELEPYPLYPLDDYFHGPAREVAPPAPAPKPLSEYRVRVGPPVRKAA